MIGYRLLMFLQDEWLTFKKKLFRGPLTRYCNVRRRAFYLYGISSARSESSDKRTTPAEG